MVGYSRGGSTLRGGILWEDWHDLKSAYGKFPWIPQIVGHTARLDKKPVFLENGLINIDLEGIEVGHIAAIYRDPGESWETVTVQRRPRK